jgi:hypothetical protein
MKNTITYFLLAASFASWFYSFYEWGIYAYNKSRSKHSLEYYKMEISEYPLKEQNEIKKIIEFLECSIPHWESNSREWLYKLLLDTIVLAIVLLMIIRARKSRIYLSSHY